MKQPPNHPLQKPHFLARHGLRSAAFALFASMLALVCPAPAFAHPHVRVSVKAVVITDKEGRITAIRHHWTFDEAFSAYATEGFEKTPDGAFEKAALADLAKTNVESLGEYGFFTVLRKGGDRRGKDKSTFAEPKDGFLTHDGKALTLHFTLPVTSAPLLAKEAVMEVYDPTFFVAFDFAAESPVTMEGSACTPDIAKPQPATTQRLSQMSERFFQSLSAGNSTADWALPVQFQCP